MDETKNQSRSNQIIASVAAIILTVLGSGQYHVDKTNAEIYELTKAVQQAVFENRQISEKINKISLDEIKSMVDEGHAKTRALIAKECK